MTKDAHGHLQTVKTDTPGARASLTTPADTEARGLSMGDEYEDEDPDPYTAPAPSAPPQPQMVFRPGADGQLRLMELPLD